MVKLINRTEEFIAVGLTVIMGSLVFTGVVLRFIFGLGYGWMEELARVCFIWVVFLGAVVGMQYGLHIRVTVGLRLFPNRIRKYVEILSDFTVLLFCIALCWHAIELVASTLDMPFLLPSTGISMFWAYMVVPLSFGLQTLRLIIRLLHKEKGESNV